MISVIVFVKICLVIQDMVHLNNLSTPVGKEYKYQLGSTDSRLFASSVSLLVLCVSVLLTDERRV